MLRSKQFFVFATLLSFPVASDVFDLSGPVIMSRLNGYIGLQCELLGLNRVLIEDVHDVLLIS